MFRKAKAAPPPINACNANVQPSLTGLWEDGAGMMRVYLTLSPNLNGYNIVSESGEKNNNNTILSYLTDGKNNVILSAPWGEGGKMRCYEGIVEQNGTKITWVGFRGNTEWFRITQ